MRRYILIIICMISALTISGCTAVYKDKHIPDGYISSKVYKDAKEFMDYTDFCIYRYDSVIKIEEDSAYQMITDNDIEKIKGYFADFKKWMEVSNRLDEYSFDEKCISAGDYVFIKTKEGQPLGKSTYGKYDNYSVYFFDVDTVTLYYIHSST